MILNSFPHLCTIIDVLSDVGDLVFINMSLVVRTIGVWDDVIIDTVDVLTDVWGLEYLLILTY